MEGVSAVQRRSDSAARGTAETPASELELGRRGGSPKRSSTYMQRPAPRAQRCASAESVLCTGQKKRRPSWGASDAVINTNPTHYILKQSAVKRRVDSNVESRPEINHSAISLQHSLRLAGFDSRGPQEDTVLEPFGEET
jgi:hypothetical protein